MSKDRDLIDRTEKAGDGFRCTIEHSTTGEVLALGSSLEHEAAIARAFARLCRKTFGDRGPARSADWILRVRLEPIGAADMAAAI